MSYLKHRRRKKLNEQSELIGMLYRSEIRRSVENSLIFDHSAQAQAMSNEPEHVIYDYDSISFLFDVHDPDFDLPMPDTRISQLKICLLNIISYTESGEIILIGGSEEMLCKESTLWNVLSDPSLKKHHQANLQKEAALAFYHRDVFFFRNGIEIKADVLSVPAPEEDLESISGLIKSIASILENQGVNIFITCPVSSSGRNISGVADLWKKTLYGDHLEMIVHPMFGKTRIAGIFRNIFRK